jgi:protein-S-isoprenylcysteine O-methyltransferase Ste14
LIAIIPAHLLYLIYFEELEVGLRLGPAYLEYKQSVPFLIPRRAT